MNVYKSIIQGLNEAVEHEKKNIKAKKVTLSEKSKFIKIKAPKR